MATTLKQPVLPLFLMQDHIPFSDPPVTTFELCTAAEAATGPGTVEGAQKIRGLWRIYLTTAPSRETLLNKGLVLRDEVIPVNDKNPFVSKSSDGIYTLFHDLPLSFDNREIEKWLTQNNLNPVSEIRYQFARDPATNKLTNFKTGSRSVFLSCNPRNIPLKAELGLFNARVWFPDYKQYQSPPRLEDARCVRCLGSGHSREQCTRDVVCLVCKEEGHRKNACPQIVPPADVDPRTLSQVSSAASNTQPLMYEVESEAAESLTTTPEDDKALGDLLRSVLRMAKRAPVQKGPRRRPQRKKRRFSSGSAATQRDAPEESSGTPTPTSVNAALSAPTHLTGGQQSIMKWVSDATKDNEPGQQSHND